MSPEAADLQTVERTPAGGWRRAEAAYNAAWIKRIRSKCIITESGCWEWQGTCQVSRNQKPGQKGYGATNYRNRTVRVHRKMLELTLGRPLPPEMHACHTCDNRPCCNPEHLYEATNSENHQDGGKRGRMQGQWKTQCAHGHNFTPENTFIQVRGGITRRICRECRRVRSQIDWQRNPNRRARQKLRRQNLRAVSAPKTTPEGT